MKNLTLVLSLHLIGCTLIFGARRPYDLSEVQTKMEKLVVDARIIQWEKYFQSIVWVNDSTFYCNPDGTLHLFKIEISDTCKVEKLSSSIYHGNTFGRYFFVKDGVPYQFGGNGLFTYNRNLLKFDFGAKQWFEVEIENLNENYLYRFYTWKYKNGLLTMFKLREPNDEVAFGFINLDNLTFELYGQKSFELSDYKLGTHHPMDHTSGFDIMYTQNAEIYNYYLYDSSTGKISIPAFYQNREKANGFNAAYVQDSTLYYRSSNGQIDSTPFHETTIVREVDVLGHFERIKEANTKPHQKQPPLTIFFGAISSLGLLIGLGLYFSKKKSKELKVVASDNVLETQESEDLSANETFQLEKLLKPYIGKSLSRKEFDKLLKIESKNSDLTKANRSRLVQAINANGIIKIDRIRDQKDRRVFKYYISEFDGES